MPAKAPIGLFFTDQSVEISQVSQDGKKLVLYNYLPLPSGLVDNGVIRNSANFTQILRQLLATAKPSAVESGEEVVIGINDNKIFLREMSVQKLPGKDISDAIDYQVRMTLPVLPSGVVTDWQIIGKDGDGQIEVLLAAAPKEIIDSYMEACLSVGLRVSAIEPAVFATVRVINQELFKNKNQLLVYLGDNFGVFSYITGGNPRFSEFLSEAEISKTGDISKTIYSYINFANSKHPTRQVEKVIISGYSPDIPRVVADLKSQGVNVDMSVSRLVSSKAGDPLLLHTVHGLSLKFLDGLPSVNLIPQESRLESVRESLTDSWKGILDLMMVITFLGIMGMLFLNQAETDRRDRLTNTKNQINQELSRPENQELIKQTNELNLVTGRMVFLRDIVGGEENITRTLSAITPEGISLTSVTFTRNPGSKRLLDPKSSWIITGTANSRPLVLNFYNELITMPDFAGGKLYFGSLEKDIGLSFRIANQHKP